MKKLSVCLFTGILCLLFCTCTKQYSPTSDPDSRLISSAEAYFTGQVALVGPVNPDNYRALQPKSVLWDQAYVVTLSLGKGVVVPVEYRNTLLVKTGFGGGHSYNLSGFTRLLIYTDGQQQFHAQLVTSLPDSLCLSDPGKGFTGTILVENWQGDHIADYLFQKGKAPLKYVFGPPPGKVAASVVVSCNNVITGYNYPEDNPDAGYAWSEPAPCTSMYLPDDQVTGDPVAGDYAAGSGGGSNASTSTVNPATMIVYAGTTPIANVKQYIQCFQNTGNASTYKVTLYVDQPLPGSRAPYTVGGQNKNGLYNIGHTFLTFQQSGPTGTIVRSMGFYPKSWVSPVNPTDQGSLNNDEDDIYNISLTITLTGQQFMNILNTCAEGNAVNYDLNNNNCATWALYSLQAGGININATRGTWPFGGGDDPGDLGEDIRYMPLSTNMTRSVQSGSSLINTGTCQ